MEHKTFHDKHVEPTMNETIRPRVLVVDNREDTRMIHSGNLRMWGYEPIEASGFGKELLNDARQKAKRFCCHVAIVDMRLIDDYDDEDISGLDLVADLQPTQCIISSSFDQDPEQSLLAIKEKGAFHFIPKSKPPARLKEVIGEALESISAGPYGPGIDYRPPSLPRDITASLGMKSPEEISDLLKQLFPENKQLRVEIITGEPHIPSSTIRLRNVPLSVFADSRQPVVVKVARIERSEIERDNYSRYIEDQFKKTFYARIRRNATRWHLGAILYDFVGNETRRFVPFSQFFADKETPIEEIENVLIELYEMWGEHYQFTRERSTESLFKLYSTVWGDDWINRLRKVQKEGIDFSTISEFIPEPIDSVAWLLKKIRLSEDGASCPDLEFSSDTAIGHGDMLGENILIPADGMKHPWIIDYERTGRGPILQDFVQLEIDILVRLSNFTPDDLSAFYALSTETTSRFLLEKASSMEFTSGKEERAYRAIAVIRKQATRYLDDDKRPYYWGALMNCIFRATLLENKKNLSHKDDELERIKSEQERAYLLATILAHRLDHKGTTWPPKEWDTELK